MQPRVDFALNRPSFVFAIALSLLWLSTSVGASARRWRPLKDDEHETFDMMLGSTLTLLGLIIGFSFSIAGARYDQRKNLEMAEANAIGTEFVRADLLPSGDAFKLKHLLQKYLDQRILFYDERLDANLSRIESATSQLHHEMWQAVRSVADVSPTAVVALAVSGMNDVLNSEGYTQGAWWYRIPEGAWGLMAVISIVSCALMGYGARAARQSLLLLVPLALSIAFFFIADIDSPRHGVIQTEPHNLVRLAETIRLNGARAEHLTPAHAP
jgi:hypothetical protein